MKNRIKHLNDVICFTKIYNKWVVLIGKKRWRFCQRRIDHNSHHNRNILRTKGGKCKTTKGVPGCYGYHEICWWNSGWCLCQRLCSLHKMDQRVIRQTFYGLLKGNKITRHHRLRRKCPSCFAKSHFLHIFHTDLGQPPVPWGVSRRHFAFI